MVARELAEKKMELMDLRSKAGLQRAEALRENTRINEEKAELASKFSKCELHAAEVDTVNKTSKQQLHDAEANAAKYKDQLKHCAETALTENCQIRKHKNTRN